MKLNKTLISMISTWVSIPLIFLIGLLGKTSSAWAVTYAGFFLVGAIIFLVSDYKRGISWFSKLFLISIFAFVTYIIFEVHKGLEHDELTSIFHGVGFILGVSIPVWLCIIFLIVLAFKRNSNSEFFKVTKTDGIKFLIIFGLFFIIEGIIASGIVFDKNITSFSGFKFIAPSVILAIYTSLILSISKWNQSKSIGK